MKNLLPFGNAVRECDMCHGSGFIAHTGGRIVAASREMRDSYCPQCNGLGEFRPQPKAIAGPENYALNHERPKFDYGRFLGQLEVLTENLRALESLGYAITEDLPDNDMNESASDMLAALSHAAEKARQLLRRAEALKTR